MSCEADVEAAPEGEDKQVTQARKQAMEGILNSMAPLKAKQGKPDSDDEGKGRGGRGRSAAGGQPKNETKAWLIFLVTTCARKTKRRPKWTSGSKGFGLKMPLEPSSSARLRSLSTKSRNVGNDLHQFPGNEEAISKVKRVPMTGSESEREGKEEMDFHPC